MDSPYREAPPTPPVPRWQARGWLVPAIGIPLAMLIAAGALAMRVRDARKHMTASPTYESLPAPLGRLEVDTYGPAVCEVDGIRRAQVPFTLTLPAGTYDVTCAVEVYDVVHAKKTTATVKDGVKTSIKLKLL